MRFLMISMLCGTGLWASRGGDFREHTKQASSIVLGRVSETRSYYGSDGEIYSDVTLTVNSTLKESGRKAAGIRTFTVKGGSVGGTTVMFTNVPAFESDEAVVLFFEGDEPLEKYGLRGDWIPELGESATKVLGEIERSLEGSQDAVPLIERQRARAFLLELNATAPAPPADAACFVLIGPRWNNSVATYKYGSTIPANWRAALDASVASWNRAGTPFNFRPDPGSANEFLVGPVSGTSTLAVTRISWDASGRMINFTMTFNSAVNWSPTGEGGKFDVEAVTAHELGHALGLNHPSGNACSEQTLWASAAAGETKKRSLENGDRAGVARLYPTVATPPATAPPAPPPAPPPVPPAPGFTSTSVFPAPPRATQPFVLWMVGTGINPETAQAVITGPGCAPCLVSPTFRSTTLLSHLVTLNTRGNFTIAIRNGATGALSATRSFSVQ